MAQSVQIILEDDLDGGHADETVRFSLDDRQYEIDLSTENAEKLREAVNPFVSSARRARGNQGGRTKRSRGAGTKSSSGSNLETKKIRAWALENGHQVSDRGRIPSGVIEAYAAAQ